MEHGMEQKTQKGKKESKSDGQKEIPEPLIFKASGGRTPLGTRTLDTLIKRKFGCIIMQRN